MSSSFTKAAANVTRASAEHDLKSSLRDGADRAEAAAHKLYGQASDAARDAGNKLHDFADTARSNVRDATGNAVDRASDQVRANPVPAALIALGIGVAIGLFLRGSRN